VELKKGDAVTVTFTGTVSCQQQYNKTQYWAIDSVGRVRHVAPDNDIVKVAEPYYETDAFYRLVGTDQVYKRLANGWRPAGASSSTCMHGQLDRVPLVKLVPEGPPVIA
jgi:hypothetical protein